MDAATSAVLVKWMIVGMSVSVVTLGIVAVTSIICLVRAKREPVNINIEDLINTGSKL